MLRRFSTGDLARRLQLRGDRGGVVRRLREFIPQLPDFGRARGRRGVAQLLKFRGVVGRLSLRQSLRHRELGLQCRRVGPGLPGVCFAGFAACTFGIQPPLEFVNRAPAGLGTLLRRLAQPPLLGQLVKTSASRRRWEVDR